LKNIVFDFSAENKKFAKNTPRMSWHLIETARKDFEEKPILLARFRAGADVPDYVVSAVWGTAFPSTIQCAFYSGWFVDGVPLEDPPKRRRGAQIMSGVVSFELDCAPTHWMEIPV
jgi:hypothetical protein